MAGSLRQPILKSPAVSKKSSRGWLSVIDPAVHPFPEEADSLYTALMSEI